MDAGVVNISCTFPHDSRALGCQLQLCRVNLKIHSDCISLILIRVQPVNFIKVSVEGFYEIVSVDSVEESGNFTSIKELTIFNLKPIYVTPNITNIGKVLYLYSSMMITMFFL